MTTGSVTGIGLLLDIVGAFFLAQSFLLKSMKQAVKEANDYLGGNPFRLKSTVIQTIEAKVGFAYLTLGFLLQYLATTNLFHSGSQSDWTLLLLGFIILLISIKVVRNIGEAKGNKAIVEEMGDMIKRDLQNAIDENDTKNLKNQPLFYGHSLGLARAKDESDLAYANKVVDAINKISNE